VAGPPHTLTAFSDSPDGRWLLATAETSNQLLVFDLANPARPVLSRSVPMEAGPFESIFTWDGRMVVVTNLRANAVSLLDPEGWRVNGVVRHTIFVLPHGLALSPDGRFVYFSSRLQSGGAHDHVGMNAAGSGTVSVLCIPTGAISVLPAGHYAAGLSAPRPALPPVRPEGCD
jgi:DNA-binding beta-propeller fold protein YncE